MQMFEEILLSWKFFIEQDFFQSDWSKTGENMQIKCKFHGNQKPWYKEGFKSRKTVLIILAQD